MKRGRSARAPILARARASRRAALLREPILLGAEGRIVDGRNLYRAFLAAGAESRFVE